MCLCTIQAHGMLSGSIIFCQVLDPSAGSYLLWDGASPRLAKPVGIWTPYNHPLQDQGQGRYNIHHSRAGSLVEGDFGMKKTRWRATLYQRPWRSVHVGTRHYCLLCILMKSGRDGLPPTWGRSPWCPPRGHLLCLFWFYWVLTSKNKAVLMFVHQYKLHKLAKPFLFLNQLISFLCNCNQLGYFPMIWEWYTL